MQSGKSKGTVAGPSKPMRDYMSGKISSTDYLRSAKSLTGSAAPPPPKKG